MSNSEKGQSIIHHLAELRRRIIVSLVVIIVASSVSFTFARYAFEFLLSNVPSNINFVYTDITEMAGTYVSVSLYCGLLIASPVIIYQIIAFIHPALTGQEKRYLYTIMPMILAFFFAGAAYAYYVFLPPTLELLMQYKWIPEVGTRIIPMIKIGSYISFTASALFWIGLCFELPALIFLLAKIGLVSYRWLLKQWKWAIIGIFIFAGLITPTGNPANQNISDIILLDLGFIVSAPIFILYFLSILLAWLAKKPEKAPLVVTVSQD
ncbi:MAG: twin-arginine translocase subunit TatC [Dehalococcoidia bacterium]|jgi:sec-independent protein translocase protein TatC